MSFPSGSEGINVETLEIVFGSGTSLGVSTEADRFEKDFCRGLCGRRDLFETRAGCGTGEQGLALEYWNTVAHINRK